MIVIVKITIEIIWVCKFNNRRQRRRDDDTTTSMAGNDHARSEHEHREQQAKTHFFSFFTLLSPLLKNF